MDFREAKVGMEVLGKYACGQLRDWGDDENRMVPIDGCFEFEHDKCCITLPRVSSDPDLTPDEIDALEKAGWWFDGENGAWCHF